MSLSTKIANSTRLTGRVLASSGNTAIVGIGNLRFRATSTIGEVQVGERVIVLKYDTLGVIIGRVETQNEQSSSTPPPRIVPTGSQEQVVTDTDDSGIYAGDAAGGDLSGQYPDPTVIGLRGKPITSTPPSDGQVLKYDGSNDEYIFADEAGGSSAVGGDLSGTTDNATVVGIQGRNVDSVAPAIGQAYRWDGSKWVPQDDPTEVDPVYSADKPNIVFDGDSAGGDLSGAYPNPIVVAIHGRPIDAATPSVGQVYRWDGNKWVPQSDPAFDGGSAIDNVIDTIDGGDANGY